MCDLEVNTACYAWTDAQIIYLTQLCRVDSMQGMADLFVLELSRISTILLEALGETEIFHRIYRLSPPPAYSGSGLRAIPGIKTISLGRSVQAHFNAEIASLGELPDYRELFTAGLWGETLHFIRAVWGNRTPEIHLIEEGFYSYVKDARKCRLDNAQKEFIERFLRYGGRAVKARRMVRDIRVFCPDIMRVKVPYAIRSLTPIDLRSSFWIQLAKKIVPLELAEEYDKRQVVFLMSPRKQKYEETLDETISVIDVVMRQVGPENMIVRLHPADRSAEEVLRAKYPDEPLYIDYTTFWLESLGALADFQKTIFVVRNSSVLLSLLEMDIHSQRMCLTYKLYNYYRKHGDVYRDYLSEQLRKSFDIRVPEDYEELKTSLILERGEK